MKKIIIAISALWISTNLISQNTMTYEEKISYIIGYNIGQQMAQDPFAFNADAIHKGIKLALSKEKIEFTEQEMQQTMQEWQQKMQADLQDRTKADLDKNKAEGTAFLERNKQNEGVKVTESGLQYKVERMGDGVKPTSANDKVSAHYEGTLLDGTVFDSSYERGEPMTFALNQVIKGWTEGLQLMPVGSKFIFYIPSELGYGDTASGPIPAGATLIFTVELFGVNQ